MERVPRPGEATRTKPPAAPGPEAAEPVAVEPAAPELAEGPIIVSLASDDPRRVDREAFLERLRAMATTTARRALGARMEDCPYIDAWFERHAMTDAAALERMLRRYAGLRGATSAAEILEAVRARLELGLVYWRSGEDVGRELALAGLGEAAQAVAAHDGVAGAIDGDEAQAGRVAAELGDGSAVSSLAAPHGVRLHTDATAARLADRAEAHAFTIGNDIVLGAGAPQPGSLAGNLLLAHELAHVEQQRAGTGGARASASATEADADRAAIGTALGGPARATVPTSLSLQRCSKKSTQIDDAGTTPTPTPSDAAVPPAMTSWVHTIVKTAPKTSVKMSEYGNFEAIAKDYYGESHLAKLIEQQNPNLKPDKLNPNAVASVPHSVEVPEAASEIPDNVDDPSSIAYQTWLVERDPRGAAQSLLPSVPPKSTTSGVTLGHGYDMGSRSASAIENDLIAAGVDKDLAKKYRGAAGKTGKTARNWIKKAGPFDPITAEQEKKLFVSEYRAVTDETVAFLVNKTGYDTTATKDGTDYKLKIDFAAMNPTILALLVDLKFKGNLNDTSWAYVEPAVTKNDLPALQALIADKKGYQKNISENWNRYEARCKLIGATAVAEKDWK